MTKPIVTVPTVKWRELCQRGGQPSNYEVVVVKAPSPVVFDHASDVLHFVSEMTDVLGTELTHDVVDTMELVYDTDPDSITVTFRGLVLV